MWDHDLGSRWILFSCGIPKSFPLYTRINALTIIGIQYYCQFLTSSFLWMGAFWSKSSSSVEDVEKSDSSVHFFDSPPEEIFNSMRKVRNLNFPAKVRRVAIRIRSQFTIHSPLLKLQKNALDLWKRLGISIISDETPIIRRIMKSLKKELENKW